MLWGGGGLKEDKENGNESVVSDLYILRVGLPILLQPNRQTNPGNM